MFRKKEKSEPTSPRKNRPTPRQNSSEENPKTFSGLWNSIPLSSKKKSTEFSGPNSPSPSHKNFSVEKYSQNTTPNRIKKMNDLALAANDSDSVLKLRTDIKDLRLQYESEIYNMKKENSNLLAQINQTKAELEHILRQQNFLKNGFDQLDIGIRVLSKAVRNIQEHYSKLVPFVLENIMLLMRKQEYLDQQQKYCENLCSKNIFLNESLNTSIYNMSNSNSKTYSICISPTVDKDLYKLNFYPLENVKATNITEKAKEYIYSLPEIYETTMEPPLQSFANPYQKNKKIILGSKTIPYYIKRIENSSVKSVEERNARKEGECRPRSSVIDATKESHPNTTIELDSQLLTNLQKTNIQFRDLKKRYLNWKYRGFLSRSFPRLKDPQIDEEDYIEDRTDGSFIKEDSSTKDVRQPNNEEFVCQSETEIFGDKFFITATDNCLDLNLNNATNVIYQCLTKLEINELRKFEIFDSVSLPNNVSSFSHEFSIILPRSKLSAILSNNFSNITEALISSDDEREETDFKQNKIDKTYKVKGFLSKNEVSPSVRLASFESLSDNETYMDDDYGQQFLLSQNYLDNSYEQLFANLDEFNLPKSYSKDVFNDIK